MANSTPPVDQLRAQQVAQETSLRLWLPAVKLTIARQSSAPTGSNPGYFQTVGNAIQITDLRVQFDVKKNLGKTPNTCNVTVSNLSKATRTELEARPLYAILEAGYDGVPRLLFAGNVSFAVSRREKTEWETKLQIADGLRAYAYARMSRSYSKPISVFDVLSDAAKSMGLQLPPEVEQSPDLRQALANGISMHGPTRDILTKLLAPYGYGWSIQNGRLQVLADEQVSQTSAILINQEAGLLGSPEHSIPARAGDPSDLSFETMIYPEIQPGGSVDMDSESTQGVYKVQDVSHVGDTYGDSWSTKVKALPLGAVKTKRSKR